MKKFNGKKFMYGTGSVLICVIFIAVIILFNFIVTTVTEKYSLKYDFTKDKIYELSEDTVKFMKKLDKPISLYYFVQDVTMTSNITETLQKMAALNKNVNYSLVSADKNPTLAQKYITSDTKLGTYTIAVDNGKNFKLINYEDFFGYNPISQQNDILVVESKIVAAINTVSRDKKITVGFTTGHGEDTADVIKKYFKDDNIANTDINLISDDFKTKCDIVCVAAPSTDFTADEIDRLDTYIKAGGKVQVFFGFNSDALPKLYSYLGECGIEVGNNMVIEQDANRVIGNTGYNFTATLQEHDSTKNLIENGNVNIVQLSRTVTPLWEGRNGYTVKSIQKSSSKAQSQNIDNGEVLKTGEQSLGVISQYISENGTGGTIFVSGSYVSYIGSYAEYNKDLLLSITTWMAQNEESYNISPKLLSLTKLKISQLSIVLWMMVVVYVLPAIVFIFGIFVWYRRKNL